jgi:hypothetical protein
MSIQVQALDVEKEYGHTTKSHKPFSWIVVKYAKKN